jgi:hypothetical protein
MAVAVILDIEGGTLEKYDQGIEKLGFTKGGQGSPDCLFHWVTTSEDGIRVVDVWSSREAWERFAQEKIGPMSQEVGLPAPSRTRFCEVHNYLTGG